MVKQSKRSQRSFFATLRRVLLGKPLSVSDSSIFHKLALIPFLAWVGLGADGLSSSAYGPSEAFLTIGQHHYLALPLALMTAITVLIIATAYSYLIESFPTGGGGYLVASKLLGPKAGVVSGAALLVDYVLTITVSIAAAGDALFSLLPPHWHHLKLSVAAVLIVGLILLNLRGVKESVVALLPIFILFLLTHALLIGGAFIEGASAAASHAAALSNDFRHDTSTIGFMGIFLLFLRAYAMGGGTYTGLEAVSNGLPIMREPRVQTGKRTMLYMALSLALTAGGLFFGYLLMGSSFVAGKTLNMVLAEQVFHAWPFGKTLVLLTLISEGALLVVAAQAGFIDGPRVLANMSLDGWMPRRFAALSDRLTSHNGILLMGVASLAALLMTGGDVGRLVVMYSINVFLTFSLSMIAMFRANLKNPTGNSWIRLRNLIIFGIGSVLCVAILGVTIYEKTEAGGWLTILATSAVVSVALLIKKHYTAIGKQVAAVDKELPESIPHHEGPTLPFKPDAPTAVILVGAYQGIGVKLIQTVFSSFPNLYQNVMFISVGVVDSGTFKGAAEVENLKASIEASLKKYEQLARHLGFPVKTAHAIGTDPVDVLEKICLEVASDLKQVVFFAGQLVFEEDRWYHGLLHNQTAFVLQKRLLRDHRTLIVVPIETEHKKKSHPEDEDPFHIPQTAH